MPYYVTELCVDSSQILPLLHTWGQIFQWNMFHVFPFTVMETCLMYRIHRVIRLWYRGLCSSDCPIVATCYGFMYLRYCQINTRTVPTLFITSGLPPTTRTTSHKLTCKKHVSQRYIWFCVFNHVPESLVKWILFIGIGLSWVLVIGLE